MRTIYGKLEPETLVYNALPSADTDWFSVNENIKKVKYGSGIIAVGFTCNLSLVNGTAFITNPYLDLRQYVGFKITLNDGSKNLVGWIKAAGTGETLGSEILTNPTFDVNTNGWNGDNCTLASIAGGQSNNCLEQTRTAGTPNARELNNVTVNGGLYVGSTYYKSGTAGNGAMAGVRILSAAFVVLKAGSVMSSGAWQLQPGVYATAVGINTICYVTGVTAAGTTLFDEVSFKQVLTPSLTGVRIVSAKGGSTYNWESDGGIDSNATSFTATITGE